MSDLTYRGLFNPLLLIEEVEAAVPRLITTDSEGTRLSLFTLSYDVEAQVLRISLQVRIDTTLIDAVVRDHDPRGKSSGEILRDRREALRAGVLQKFRDLGFTDAEISVMHEVLRDA